MTSAALFAPAGRPSRAAPACAIALAAAASHAQPARYQLDPEHIGAGFLVEHIGHAKVPGMFRAVRGTFKRGSYGVTCAVENGWVGDDAPPSIEFEAIRQ